MKKLYSLSKIYLDEYRLSEVTSNQDNSDSEEEDEESEGKYIYF